ncbi:MAG: alpha/beta hydrolase [Bacilli bacterium]|nr:alpha/beta hydrolase [Bacilli bacterium]
MKKVAVKNNHPAMSEKKKNVLIISGAILFVIFMVLMAFLTYFLKSYCATSEAKQFLKSDDDVSVVNENDYYTFSPKKVERGLVFYQGMKVENIAYAPLMYHFAKDTNTFCALINAPLNFPLFNINGAHQPISKHSEIKNWYVAGHSLGGTIASIYASKHLSELKGLIMLGAYTNANLSEAHLKVAEIYGDQDGVMNRASYEKSQAILPSDKMEHIIIDGNHSGFGMYGEQYRDGIAKISKIDQIKETVNFCQEFFTKSE